MPSQTGSPPKGGRHTKSRTSRNRICAVAIRLLVSIMILGVLNACSQTAERKGPLISEKTTMVTAWQVPLDPTKDPSLTDPRLADQIKWGYRIFTNTPHEAARFTGGNVSCNNCHLNAGQRERSLPLVGVAGMFPEYNGRAARLISLYKTPPRRRTRHRQRRGRHHRPRPREDHRLLNELPRM